MWFFKKKNEITEKITKIRFKPKKNITAYELSQCLQVLNGLQHSHFIDWGKNKKEFAKQFNAIYEQWPNTIKKHFEIENI